VPSVDASGSRNFQVGDHNRQLNLTRNSYSVRAAAAIPVAVVLVAISGVVLYLKPWDPGPRLSLTGLAVATAAEVDGTAFEEWTVDGRNERHDVEQTRIDATPVDITVTNTGSDPVIITGAEVRIVFAEELADCVQTGGPLQLEAKYDVALPRPLPARPFTVRHPMRFEVAPDASGRFALTIGPLTQEIESWAADLFVAEIALKVNYRPEPIPLGKAAWASAAGQGIDNLNAGLGADRDCLTSNAALMRRLGAIPARRSEEITALLKRFDALERAHFPGPACATVAAYDSPAGVNGLCALRTPDLLMAHVSTVAGVAAARHLVLGLGPEGQPAQYVVRCVLRVTVPAQREVTLRPVGDRRKDAGACSDFSALHSVATLYGYPNGLPRWPAVRVSAVIVDPGVSTADALASPPGAAVVLPA
jgi:hypothetical protein